MPFLCQKINKQTNKQTNSCSIGTGTELLKSSKLPKYSHGSCCNLEAPIQAQKKPQSYSPFFSFAAQKMQHIFFLCSTCSLCRFVCCICVCEKTKENVPVYVKTYKQIMHQIKENTDRDNNVAFSFERLNSRVRAPILFLKKHILQYIETLFMYFSRFNSFLHSHLA